MPDRPPLHKQETDYSCAVACLRMVLEHLGIVKSEAELRDQCHTDWDGTAPFILVRVAKSLGLDKSESTTLNLEELKAELDRGIFPIVYIKDRLTEGQRPQQHAVVLIEMNQIEAITLDPVRGEYKFSLE